MRRMGILSALALATTVVVGCNDRTGTAVPDTAGNGSAVGTSGTAADMASSADKAFVEDLTVANMAEVELGKLALEHSTNADVKAFGRMMIDDHSQAGAKLSAVASEHAIATPTALDTAHRELRDKLASLQGAAFDRAYIDAMADGHGKVLNMLESRIDKDNLADWKTRMTDRLKLKTAEESGEPIAILPEKSDNPATFAVNQWAADSYPVVHRHLDKANTIHDAMAKRSRSTQ